MTLVPVLVLRDSVALDADSWERVEVLAAHLAAAVDVKAAYHPSHCQAVADLSQLLGAALGIRGEALFRLKTAGLLHDVGKLALADAILLKPDRLTPIEYDVVKQHPVTGHNMLQQLGLPDEARWVLHHHERGDGTGYPTGLAGDAIPLEARIILVADAYDCLVADRVYRRGATPHEALAEIVRCTPDQFDPVIVAALTALIVARHGPAPA